MQGLLKLGVVLVACLLTVMLVRALDARRLPDLSVWHQDPFQQEYSLFTCPEVETWADYLECEQLVFEELDERIVEVQASSDGGDNETLSRFNPRAPSYPEAAPTNWNRSFEWSVEEPWGAVVLVHGLTDSPYSVRALGELFRDAGLAVVAPRMPGHGLAPAGLLEAKWTDWLAVLEMAVRHAKAQVGEGRPLVLVGYSNGGTLVTKYTANAVLRGDSAAIPDSLYLFSPAIGLTRFAAFANWHRLFANIPYFEKFRWESVLPEYDPYKYNSFAKIAGHETWALTRQLDRDLETLSRTDKMHQVPPILAFQSLVDSTVLTESVVGGLFERLKGPNNELVLFDLNRYGRLDDLIRSPCDSLLQRLTESPPSNYILTLLTNRDETSREVVEHRFAPGWESVEPEPLGLAWPEGVYSLSHVAIPFPPDDPLYGDRHPDSGESFILGNLAPRGEKKVLTVSVEQLMRLRYNPFYSVLSQRLEQSLMQLRAAHEP